MIKTLINRFRSNPVRKTLYDIAFLFGSAYICLIALDLWFKQTDYLNGSTNYLLLASGALFAAGFVFWLAPITYGINKKKLSRLALTAIHAFAIVLSFIPARQVVSVALGLPPTDFDLTVAIFSFILYPLVWLYLSILISFILYMFFIVDFFFIALISQGIILSDLFMPFIEALSPTVAERYRSSKGRLGTRVTNAIGHFAGIAAITVLLVSSLSLTQNIPSSLIIPVRFVSYFADYHFLHAYPGIASSAKSKLHPNGIVSYAIPHDGFAIEILVTQIDAAQIETDLSK